jgi:hypothetical protein
MPSDKLSWIQQFLAQYFLISESQDLFLPNKFETLNPTPNTFMVFYFEGGKKNSVEQKFKITNKKESKNIEIRLGCLGERCRKE